MRPSQVLLMVFLSATLVACRDDEKSGGHPNGTTTDTTPACAVAGQYCYYDSDCCSGFECHPNQFKCQDRATCLDVGYCGPTEDACNCGTYCLSGASGYSCGDGCSGNSDCTGLINPRTGQLYSQCILSQAGYDNWCE